MQCNSGTLYQLFKLSASHSNLCLQSLINRLIIDHLLNAWRVSDIASTRWHLEQAANRPTLVALPSYCSPQH